MAILIHSTTKNQSGTKDAEEKLKHLLYKNF